MMMIIKKRKKDVVNYNLKIITNIKENRDIYKII